MKYEVDMCRTETKQVVLYDMPSRDKAVKMATVSTPGFTAESVTEIHDNGFCNTFAVVGKCEACGLILFDDSPYFISSDDGDVRLCLECARGIEAEEFCDG